MGKSPCCDKTNGLKKGPWTAEEDQILVQYIQKHGHGRWRILPKNAGLKRCGKSCRLRWTNYLRPDIKRGKFSVEEENVIIQLHSVLGNKWSAIAARLPGRTDNEIKNYWNTHIKKKLFRMGIDPVTHAPRLDLLELSSYLNPSGQLNVTSLLGLMGALVPPNNQDFLNLAANLLPSQNMQIQTEVQNLDCFQQQNQLLQSTPVHVQSDDLNQFSEIPTSTLATSQCSDPNMWQVNFGSFPNNSALNSTSACTYFNCSTVDERDSYCSSMLMVDAPNDLNVNIGCI